MSEKPPNSASLILNEDAEKLPLPNRGDLRRCLRRAMEKRASSVKERVSSFSRSSLKGFFRRNLFVLFTVAAVALGEDDGEFDGFSILDFCVSVPRSDPRFFSPSSQPFNEGDQILCFSWRAPDENAADARASSDRLKFSHRFVSNQH